jgi:hypothetical protein
MIWIITPTILVSLLRLLPLRLHAEENELSRVPKFQHRTMIGKGSAVSDSMQRAFYGPWRLGVQGLCDHQLSPSLPSSHVSACASECWDGKCALWTSGLGWLLAGDLDIRHSVSESLKATPWDSTTP